MAFGVPAGGLRPLIARYHGYREHDGAPGCHRGLPSPYLTVIVTLGEPLTVATHPDVRQAPGQYDTLVGGLHTSPALITHQGRQAGVQIALSPLGTRRLLGLPAGELRNIDLDAADVLGRTAHELHERLNAASGWPERFAILDELLLRHAGRERPVPDEIARAWRLLMSSGGRVPISDLAREIGWSSRHLATRFAGEIGLSPKAAARVIRFDRTRHRLQRRAGSALGLADLAAESGYYDQAHLARDFRDLAGCSPTRWLAEEFRNVQAAASVATADSMA
ncbi:helix-turn-helix domain-containing protein [Sphaerisporangium sp. NBC_01403]|uniref:AraC family transcriptional regulator n=1 Tax=Sphaerisporangium sp. NBC_01403 TaxID=2903599 RepID=UPI0032504D81